MPRKIELDDEMQELRSEVESLREQLEIRTQECDALAQQVLQQHEPPPKQEDGVFMTEFKKGFRSGCRPSPLIFAWTILALGWLGAKTAPDMSVEEMLVVLFVLAPIGAGINWLLNRLVN